MSLERFMGIPKSQLRRMPDSEKVASFEKATLRRNETLEQDHPYTLLSAGLIGIIIGGSLYLILRKGENS